MQLQLVQVVQVQQAPLPVERLVLLPAGKHTQIVMVAAAVVALELVVVAASIVHMLAVVVVLVVVVLEALALTEMLVELQAVHKVEQAAVVVGGKAVQAQQLTHQQVQTVVLVCTVYHPSQE